MSCQIHLCLEHVWAGLYQLHRVGHLPGLALPPGGGVWTPGGAGGHHLPESPARGIKKPTKIKWIMHEMIKRILSRAFHLKMCQIWQFSGPSDMSGASAAPWTGRRGGSETGLSGKAARSTREVAYWEEHWVSVNEIISEIRQLQPWCVVLQ